MRTHTDTTQQVRTQPDVQSHGPHTQPRTPAIKEPSKHTNPHKHTHTYKHTNKQTNKQTHKQRHNETNKHTNRHTRVTSCTICCIRLKPNVCTLSAHGSLPCASACFWTHLLFLKCEEACDRIYRLPKRFASKSNSRFFSHGRDKKMLASLGERVFLDSPAFLKM